MASTSELERRIAQLERELRSVRQDLPNGALKRGVAPTPIVFLAQITGNTAHGSTAAQWRYTFAEIEITGVYTYQAKTGGRTGEAMNLTEFGHVAKSGTTAWYVDGVQANSTTTSSAYPAGFAPRPVGGGGTSATHKQNRLVWIQQVTDTTGTLRYIIERWLTQDGTCT